ncbi:hypothetical protein E1263_26520 [Kribbella antibiotica]|uniref:Uncharacterized protein n=1 Tax=Kribbella antibiotica TaxID=190195 RepID=A0A4R4ZF34_9ACTN|nr:hypothetical protein [Kribbella antibiotica]TDD55052.1 hypothetical protein E1263_26520 [Kribbella antibiotica]
MTLRLIAHEDAADSTGKDGCARVWFDDSQGGGVLVQLYEVPDGLQRIAPAEIPAGELLGRLPVATLLEAADAIRASR